MTMLDAKEKAFKSLTPKQQRVWNLYMRRGLSEYETAKVLNITRDAVHDRLNKARRRFLKTLGASNEN